MLPRPFGTQLLASALFLAAYPALPCQLIPTEFHQINPELRGVDVTPPPPPQVSAAALERRRGESCQGGVCISNSCGNLATLSIDLVAGEDDRTPASELGYRLEVLDGEIPESLRDQLGMARRASGGQLLYRPAFEDAALLDAALYVVAIDAAGNESAPSPAFRVQFDGCTLSALNDECDEAPGEGSVASCTVSNPRSTRAGAGLAGALGALALLGLRAHRRQRT
ncbi:MAG TPA: hypothetical protein VJU61_06035 [Polyangiaceae bacterium]|nr:hypothetical protein [Polyangiaceae bacterium]